MKKRTNMEGFIKVCTEFCTGCGLCHSVTNVDFKTDEKGFKYPELRKEDIPLLNK